MNEFEKAYAAPQNDAIHDQKASTQTTPTPVAKPKSTKNQDYNFNYTYKYDNKSTKQTVFGPLSAGAREQTQSPHIRSNSPHIRSNSPHIRSNSPLALDLESSSTRYKKLADVRYVVVVTLTVSSPH